MLVESDMRWFPAHSNQTLWLAALILTVASILSACSSSGNNSIPANDDSSTAPTPPDDLTYTVYSSHEIELFWSDSTDDGWVMGYDIYRDGVFVAEQLDANSYFEDNLAPETSYLYSVVAVDDEGNRSLPTDITLTTDSNEPPLNDGSGNMTAAITVDNHIELLRHVFDIYTGNAYRESVLSLPRWPIPTFETTKVADVNTDIREFKNTYICSNGGTVRFEYTYQFFGRGGTSLSTFDVERCLQDTDILDGSLTKEVSDSGPIVSSASYSISGQSLQLEFAGKVIQSLGYAGAPGQWYWTAEDLQLTRKDVNGEFVIEDANTDYLAYSSLPIYGGASMGGSVSMRSALTANLWIHAEVIEEFTLSLGTPNDVDNRPWRFPVGMLQLSGDDGSQLVFDADNGDYDTVDIEIVSANGERYELPAQSWDPWIDSLSIHIE